MFETIAHSGPGDVCDNCPPQPGAVQTQLRQESIQQVSAGERHRNTVVRVWLQVLLEAFPPQC